MLSDFLPQLFLAWSIQAMGALSPGPSVALIVGVAARQGRMPAAITALGVACASIVLSIGTVLGIAVALAQMAELASVIRLVGAAYLGWLSYKAFRAAARPTDLTAGDAPGRSGWRAGLAGFILQVSNPKALIFWLAIASVGGIGDAPLAVVVLFVLGAFVVSLVGHGGYALLLSTPPVRRAYARFHRWIDGALGCFFLLASYRLATEKL